MKRSDLERMRAWADDKISTGAEPPWSWFQMMKLRETLDAIIAGMPEAKTESLPQSSQPQGNGLRLVGTNCHQESVQRHPDAVPVQLPM